MKAPTISPSEIIEREELRSIVHKGLRAWNRVPSIKKNEIDEQPIKSFIEQALISLNSTNPFYASLLSQRFIDGQAILEIAHQHNLSQDQINRRQRAAIGELTRIIEKYLLAKQSTHEQRLLDSLAPQSYENLFGIEKIKSQLIELIASPNTPWVIALLGLGGIGKSALADNLLRSMAKTSIFEEYLWIRLDPLEDETNSIVVQKQWNQLIEKISSKILTDVIPSSEKEKIILKMLSEKRVLIVIDNLENELSQSNLINRFRTLADPGKVILTSRSKPKVGTNVHQIVLPEISSRASQALLLHHAKSIGIVDSYGSLKNRAKDIVAITGGNPLALRIVVGMLLSLPLDLILKSLEKYPVDNVEEMYRFIYQKSWHSLTSGSQKLLQVMPLVGNEGATWPHLQALVGESDLELSEIVKELISHSLLEMHGTVTNPVYGIHRLTETFLKTEIINWI